MNRRTEENLIKLAYGELPPEQAAALEAQAKADPETARMLASYRQMKGDMPRLNDIPEMQFSAERLRDAILHGGLKKRNRLAAFGWVLAPVATAALAVVLFMNRPASERIVPTNESVSNVVPPVALNTEPKPNVLNPETVKPKANAFMPETEQTNPERVVRHSVSFGSEEVASIPVQPEVNRSTSSSRHARVRNRVEPIDIEPTDSEVALVPPPTPEPAPTEEAGGVPAGPVDDASSAAKPTDQKVVVVGESTDSNTGAAKATEVGSSTNVRVGG